MNSECSQLNISNSANSLFQIGTRIGKVLAIRLTSAAPPFTDSKDAVKFVCKDLWTFTFKQQASRLQANRKGVYMIHDSSFPPLQSLAKCCISSSTGSVLGSSAVGPLSHPMLNPVAPTIGEDGTSDSNSRRSSNLSSSDRLQPAIVNRALLQLRLPAGIIQGFLESVGYACTVDPSITGCIPACAFSIVVLDSDSHLYNPLRRLKSEAIDSTTQDAII